MLLLDKLGNFDVILPTLKASLMEHSKSGHQRQTLRATSSQINDIHIAQYALKEACETARIVEGMLYHLQSRLRETEDAIEREKAKIRLQVSEGQRMDENIVSTRVKHEDRVHELSKRMSYLKEECGTDRDEKIRLLRIIDMYVHGGPSPTLADWSFYHYVGQVGYVASGEERRLLPQTSVEQHINQTLTSASAQARSFSRIVGGLAESNAWLLDRQDFFSFACSVLHNGMQQWQRGYRLNLEDNVISAAVTTDVNVSLVQALAAMDEEDLEKL